MSRPLIAAVMRSSAPMCLEAAVAPPGVLPVGSNPVSSLFLAGGSSVLNSSRAQEADLEYLKPFIL